MNFFELSMCINLAVDKVLTKVYELLKSYYLLNYMFILLKIQKNIFNIISIFVLVTNFFF